MLFAAAVALSPNASRARDTAGPDPQPAPAPNTRRVAPAPTSTPAAPPTSPSAPRAVTPAASADAADAPRGPGAEDAERAKQLYASGAEAFAAQRNADAIGYFRRAAALVPSPKLTYNIGLAYEEMDDAGRALAEYRSYLDQEAGSDPARREDVKARITRLEQRLGAMGVQQLRVKTQPAGATVRIAGRALGLTPWTGELAPGEHLLELDMPGHAPRQARVVVPADRSAELELALTPSPPPLAEPPPSRWGNVSPLTWTFLGVGAAALAGGVAFELSRASSSDEARDASDATTRAEARGAADAKQMVSLILVGFGAGFTIGGSVLLALDLSQGRGDRDQAVLGLPCGPSFCGFVTQGSF